MLQLSDEYHTHRKTIDHYDRYVIINSYRCTAI